MFVVVFFAGFVWRVAAKVWAGCALGSVFVVLPVGCFERRVAPVFSLVVWALLLPFLFGVAAVAGLLLP